MTATFCCFFILSSIFWQNLKGKQRGYKLKTKEVKPFKKNKIIIQDHEPSINPTSEELAAIILARIGLMPRKQGSTDKMHRVLLELYERAKQSYRQKKPELAVMTVEQMGCYAGISRQTMYDYLNRWTTLNIINKTSYIANSKVTIGYKLTGNTLEQSFEKVMNRIKINMELTQRYIRELQRLVKNEKISETQSGKADEPFKIEEKVAIEA